MKLEVYRRADGLYAWRLKAKNGRIIATDGGQGYARRRACAQSAHGALGRDSRLEYIELVHLFPTGPRDARDQP